MVSHDDDIKTLRDYWMALMRRRGTLFATMTLVATAAVVVALVWPPTYRSAATILIEQQEIPEDLVRSTITSFADQRIQVISQRVMTRANLNGIIGKYDLYVEDRKTEPLETVIEQMRDDIDMKMISADVVDPRSGRPTSATIAFSLSYNSRNPALAQRVANELVSLYLNENLKSRTQLATETADFVTGEVDKLDATIADLENKMAAFKEKNYDRLPELAQLNLTLTQRGQTDLDTLDRDLISMRERRTYLQAQLAQLAPYTGMRSDSGEPVLSPQDRLQILKSQLASAASVYSESHPEVIRIKRELAGLEKVVAQQSSAAITRADDGARKDLQRRLAALVAENASLHQRYAGDHPEVIRNKKEINVTRANLHLLERAEGGDNDNASETAVLGATNPAYVQLQTQLENVDRELRVAEDRRQHLLRKIDGYQSKLSAAPAVERGFRELTRDLDNAWAKYREMKAKQMEAKMAESLEAERKGERFTLIEPPERPEKPIKPNRIAILLFGLIVAIGSGLGVVLALDALDERVYGVRHLTSWDDGPPLLIAVPYIATDVELAGAVRRKWIWTAATLASMVIAAGAIHFAVMPLDVLTYAGIRRLGL